MELHQVSEGELKALCELMATEDEASQGKDANQSQRLPHYLKLIK
jgi:hypothetical protein